jgi:hypothetical protein
VTGFVIAPLALLGGVLVMLLPGLLNWFAVGEISGALQDWLEEEALRAASQLPPECADDLLGEWIEELRAMKDRPRKAIGFTLGLRAAGRDIALNEQARVPNTKKPSGGRVFVASDVAKDLSDTDNVWGVGIRGPGVLPRYTVWLTIPEGRIERRLSRQDIADSSDRTLTAAEFVRRLRWESARRHRT